MRVINGKEKLYTDWITEANLADTSVFTTVSNTLGVEFTDLRPDQYVVVFDYTNATGMRYYAREIYTLDLTYHSFDMVLNTEELSYKKNYP